MRCYIRDALIGLVTIITLLWSADCIAQAGSELLGSPFPERPHLITIASEHPAPLPKDFKIPDRVDLRPYLPPAGDQGKQNSCIAWTLAYGLKTFQENIASGPIPGEDIGVMDPKKTFSPAFAFDLSKLEFDSLDNTCRLGTYFNTIFSILVEQGCCTWDEMPYEKNDSACFQHVPAEVLKGAQQFKMAQPLRLDPRNTEQLKYHLARNEPVAISMAVDTSFMRQGLRAGKEGEDFTWHIWPKAPMPSISHAMLIVGFDDSDSTFLLFNSWGERWGDKGYGRVTYDVFRRMALEAYIASDHQGDTWAALPMIVPSARAKADRREVFKVRSTVGESLHVDDYVVGIHDLSTDKDYAHVAVHETSSGKKVRSLKLSKDRPISFYHSNELITVHYDKARRRLWGDQSLVVRVKVEENGEVPSIEHCLSQVSRMRR